MKSGWFWNTPMWAEYLQEYAKTRPECLEEYKSSPLADDHDFSDAGEGYRLTTHQSQVIDLSMHKWSDVRKSYRGLINAARKEFTVDVYKADYIPADMGIFKKLHVLANGMQPRNDETYSHQRQWMSSGNGLLVMCTDWPFTYAGAYWILYRSCAYYMSGPSIREDLQHAVIWKSLQLLKERGIKLVEMGQIDGETEKEKNIGLFKRGFGGQAKPFVIARKIRRAP